MKSQEQKELEQAELESQIAQMRKHRNAIQKTLKSLNRRRLGMQQIMDKINGEYYATLRTYQRIDLCMAEVDGRLSVLEAKQPRRRRTTAKPKQKVSQTEIDKLIAGLSEEQAAAVIETLQAKT